MVCFLSFACIIKPMETTMLKFAVIIFKAFWLVEEVYVKALRVLI